MVSGQPNTGPLGALPAFINTVVDPLLDESTGQAPGAPQGPFSSFDSTGSSLGQANFAFDNNANFETQRSQLEYSPNQIGPGAFEDQNIPFFHEARSADDWNRFSNPQPAQLGVIDASVADQLQTQTAFPLNHTIGGPSNSTEHNASEESMFNQQTFPIAQPLDEVNNFGMSCLASPQLHQPRMNIRRRRPGFGEQQNLAVIEAQNFLYGYGLFATDNTWNSPTSNYSQDNHEQGAAGR